MSGDKIQQYTFLKVLNTEFHFERSFKIFSDLYSGSKHNKGNCPQNILTCHKKEFAIKILNPV